MSNVNEKAEKMTNARQVPNRGIAVQWVILAVVLACMLTASMAGLLQNWLGLAGFSLAGLGFMLLNLSIDPAARQDLFRFLRAPEPQIPGVESDVR